MESNVAERRRTVLVELVQSQIVEAFVEAALRKGVAATTVADIVGAAHISRSTFYEHFADKEAVYLHLHRTVEAETTAALHRGVDLADPAAPWPQQVGTIVTSYLECLASEPTFLGQVQIEPQMATPAAIDSRTKAGHAFERILTAFAEGALGQADDVVVPGPDLVRAGLAGTLALVARAAEGGPDVVRGQRAVVTELWTRLIRR